MTFRFAIAIILYFCCTLAGKAQIVYDRSSFTDNLVIADSLVAADSLAELRPRLDTITCGLPVVDLRKEVDFGHDSLIIPGKTTDIIVIHTNYFVGGNAYSTQGCISQFREYRVSPHYMITHDGSILYMVDEELAAYHAGESLLPGTDRDSLNYSSIGIEVVAYPGKQMTKRQIEQLLLLVADIRKRFPIRYLMRHSDIAPKRKRDPWSINWPEFAKRVEELSGPIIWCR